MKVPIRLSKHNDNILSHKSNEKESKHQALNHSKAINLINEQLKDYEELYGISSETMRSEIRSGKRKETPDIYKWIMLTRSRDKLVTESLSRKK